MGFCTKCGRQLADGEVCGCTQQHGNAQQGFAQQGYTQQGYAQPQGYAPAQNNNGAKADFTQGFMGDIVTFLKNVIKTPADAVRTYVNKGSLIASLLILAVCAIVTTLSDVLYKIIANVRYEEQVIENISIWNPATWVANEPLYSPWKIVLGAFGDLFYTFASAAVMAGIMYALIKFVFEKDSEIKFANLFAVMALVSLVQMPFSLVYTIFRFVGLSLISTVGSWISTFGSAFSAVALWVGLKANVKNENNMFLVYACAAVVNAVMYSVLSLIGVF